MRSAGHHIGNHGYAHLDGWRYELDVYLENVRKGKDIIGSSDYRPPYGRMSPAQWRSVAKTERIIQWSIMPGDFDPEVDAQRCLERIIRDLRAGDIIVLHDNEKSWDTVRELLPPLAAYLNEKRLPAEPLPSGQRMP